MTNLQQFVQGFRFHRTQSFDFPQKTDVAVVTMLRCRVACDRAAESVQIQNKAVLTSCAGGRHKCPRPLQGDL